jgi:thiol-disulfide isomerase/thioredoxin
VSSPLARANALQSGPLAAPPVAAAAPAQAPAPGTLQRQAESATATTNAAPMTTALAGASSGASSTPSGPCIEDVVGEDPSTLVEGGVVTIIEFSGPGCTPCKMLRASLEQMCAGFKQQPPAAPVHIFSIDVAEEANEEIAKKYTAASVPRIYFYVGSTEKAHYDTALQPDVLDALVAEYTEEASQSGWWKGAKKGGKWGGLVGGIAGIIGAIAIGSESGLEGNALMGAIGGTIAGGVVAGGLIGGGIGALAGHLGEEKKGSRRKKKKQPKARHGGPRDRDELEADAMAARVMERTSGGNGSGALASGSSAGFGTGSSAQGGPAQGGTAMDAGLRLEMESHFGRDFSHVRVHRDGAASQVADSMSAYAVTEGADIYFARDSYSPHTPAGRAILAHELTHVAQQDVSGPTAPVATLESEASRVSADVAHGHEHQIGVSQAAGGDTPPLPMTRAEKTAAWSFGGAAIGAAVGVGIGLIAASQMKGTPYGEAAGWGALIGGGAGLIGGFFYGLFARRTSRVGAPEADALIRRRYGKYLPQSVPAPLRDALIRPVTKAELLERIECRRGEPGDPTTIGWTDTGTPWKGGKPPATTIPSAAAEPTCKGKQMEHATPERPVIYFQNDGNDPGILVHEGLHAVSHPQFQQLHNFMNEATTEMYTRRLLADVNIAPAPSEYEKWVPDAERFEKVVGDEALARAYFGGDVPGLDRIMTPIYGPCSMRRWAQAQQGNTGGSSEAESILANRGLDYCPVVAWWERRGGQSGGASGTPDTPFPPAPRPVSAGTPGTPATPSTPSTPSTPPPATGGSGGPHHP